MTTEIKKNVLYDSRGELISSPHFKKFMNIMNASIIKNRGFCPPSMYILYDEKGNVIASPSKELFKELGDPKERKYVAGPKTEEEYLELMGIKFLYDSKDKIIYKHFPKIERPSISWLTKK